MPVAPAKPLPLHRCLPPSLTGGWPLQACMPGS
jgi:hypothetical protein